MNLQEHKRRIERYRPWDVLDGKQECPLCTIVGVQTQQYSIEENGKSTTYVCECKEAEGKVAVLKSYGIQGNYLRANLNKLKPSSLSTLPPEKQEKLIAKVKTDPKAGWAFFGPPGAGKSTIAAALFKKAAWHIFDTRDSRVRPESLFRLTARQLCDEAQAFVMGKYEEGLPNGKYLHSGIPQLVYSPTVNRFKIVKAKNAGLKPVLWIEELDKVNLTDFRREAIFDVISAMHECQGQVILTSNLSWDDFLKEYGTTYWRVPEICYVVDLYKGTINPPKVSL